MLTQLGDVIAAPILVFIFVDTTKYPTLAAYDGALAAGNLMLAARSFGYGSSFQTSFFPKGVVREHFGVHKEYRLICAVPLGRPKEWPPAPPRKSLNELVAYEHM